MLGTANYTNGQTVGTGTFATNPSGDPAPFDRLIGDKTNGPNPSTTFTFPGYGGPIDVSDFVGDTRVRPL